MEHEEFSVDLQRLQPGSIVYVRNRAMGPAIRGTVSSVEFDAVDKRQGIEYTDDIGVKWWAWCKDIIGVYKF